jgi:hypothetical protein
MCVHTRRSTLLHCVWVRQGGRCGGAQPRRCRAEELGTSMGAAGRCAHQSSKHAEMLRLLCLLQVGGQPPAARAARLGHPGLCHPRSGAGVSGHGAGRRARQRGRAQRAQRGPAQHGMARRTLAVRPRSALLRSALAPRKCGYALLAAVVANPGGWPPSTASLPGCLTPYARRPASLL